MHSIAWRTLSKHQDTSQNASACFQNAPKTLPRRQLGAPNWSKTPKLEAQGAPRTSILRRKTLQDLTLEAQSASRTQLEAPTWPKTPKLEAQGASRTSIWRRKTLQDLKLEAQSASRTQLEDPKRVKTPSRMLQEAPERLQEVLRGLVIVPKSVLEATSSKIL